MATNFADRLLSEIEKKQNPTVVGLDPRLEQIPSFIKSEMVKKHGKNFEAAGACFFEFNRIIIDSVHDIVPAVKPQIAFYEQYGQFGIRAFDATVKYAKSRGLLVIEDGKRNDIGSTSQAYALAHLGHVNLFDRQVPCFDVDCITVNPYLGSDGVLPFVEQCKVHGKGIFVLVKTSNKSAGELQDLFVMAEGKRAAAKTRVYEQMAGLVNEWGRDTEGSSGYRSVGAVVGATYPKEAKALRKLMPKSIFLVPGYGAQGGGAEDAIPNFNRDGHGAIVNNSRGIIFAYEKHGSENHFDLAARNAAIKMKEDLNKALKKEGYSAASKSALSRHAKKSASKRTASSRSAAAKKAAQTKGAAGRSAAAKKAARTRARNKS